jgi:hypothetical protein
MPTIPVMVAPARPPANPIQTINVIADKEGDISFSPTCIIHLLKYLSINFEVEK